MTSSRSGIARRIRGSALSLERDTSVSRLEEEPLHGGGRYKSFQQTARSPRASQRWLDKTRPDCRPLVGGTPPPEYAGLAALFHGPGSPRSSVYPYS